MSTQRDNVLEVWLDCDLSPACLVGTLAPAFDINPNIDKAEHVLNIDDSDNRPSLDTVLDTAPFYGITDNHAKQILEEVTTVIDGWQDAASKARITSADINLSASAFSAHSAFRNMA